MFPSKVSSVMTFNGRTKPTPTLDLMFLSPFSLPVYEVMKLVAAPTVKLG